MIPTVDFIFLVIQCIGYCLYLLMSICFIFKLFTGDKHDGDSNTFLIHFIANCFFDLMQVAAVILMQKFLHWNLWLEVLLTNNFILLIRIPALYMTLLASVMGTTYTVVNRYCVLVYGSRFRQKWTNNVSYVLITLQLLFPLTVFSFSCINPSTVKYMESFELYFFVSPTPTEAAIVNIVFAVLIFIAIIITVSMNIIIFNKFNRLMENATKKEQKKKYLIMIYMVITTSCLICLFFEHFARIFFLIFDLGDAVNFMTYPLFWIIPISTLVQPITTMIMSKYLRQYFINFYCPKLITLEYSTTKAENVTKQHGPTHPTKIVL
uniref:Serpentine receptor class gamma n=1 Tax=Parastrongyloides trichosuri TaxID=131310 RepID=A0A0N4ZXL6_PARTI